MNLPAAYWDSSALIPLCVAQPQTAEARLLYDRFGIVTWWATQVEILSGLTRLRRMGQISEGDLHKAKQFADALMDRWLSAGSQRIAIDACSLLELYPLRAAHALQLATALEACEHRPKGYVFISADQRLGDAAHKSGFSVELI